MSLSKELRPRNIRVNALNPGLIDSDGVGAAGLMENDFTKLAVKTTPLGRIGVPQGVANVALFLASEGTYRDSGQEFIVAGGFIM